MRFPLTETLELRFSSTGLSVHELREDGRWHTKVKFGLFISFRQVWPQGESGKDIETLLADAQADSNKWFDHATEQKLRADAALTELARVRDELTATRAFVVANVGHTEKCIWWESEDDDACSCGVGDVLNSTAPAQAEGESR